MFNKLMAFLWCGAFIAGIALDNDRLADNSMICMTMYIAVINVVKCGGGK